MGKGVNIRSYYKNTWSEIKTIQCIESAKKNLDNDSLQRGAKLHGHKRDIGANEDSGATVVTVKTLPEVGV
ncbi:hypothetical protein E2C01_040496 [Portunus trituberculatus]|uniref:Uncharacterized protein n=1 Tax=Portunus trituberculatus TaxID=210409 RepID=A0A5B7FGU6_PORTR|nr:hypothetical protein [Portunus trituberculatus]